MTATRRDSLLAFGLSLFFAYSTASAVDIPGDFNGDGRMDVLLQPLTATQPGAIMLQDGTGHLTVLAQQWDAGYLGLDWSAADSYLTTADLNGDGQDDVILQSRKAGQTGAVLITDPTIQLLHVIQLLPAGYLGIDWSSAANVITAGDFDGDRQKELLLQSTKKGGPAEMLHADATGRLVVAVQQFPDGFLGRHWDARDETLYVGDFNGDGRQDLLVQSRLGGKGESAYALLLAGPDGRFTRVTQSWNDGELGVDWNPATHKLVIQDANGDGISDIVLQSLEPNGTSYVFTGNTLGILTKPAASWTGSKSVSGVLIAQASTGSKGTTAPAAVSAGGTTTNTTRAVQGTLVVNTVQAPAGNTPGTIHGKFSVDANGAANYTIPLDIPAGPGGITPKLSLIYNSQSSSGLAGYGWTLSGLSTITRCGRTIAQDGNTQGVTFTDGAGKDDYCLDGQKLRPDGSGNYRKEIDDFTQVTPETTQGQGKSPTTGPQWFQVQTKDGLTYKYGYTANSQILAVGRAFGPSECSSSNPIAVRVWALSSISDSSGNSVSFTYANDTSTTCTGDYWPTSVTYGGGTGSQHKITFGYDDLASLSPVPADLKVSYRGGAAVGHTKRLNAINIIYNNSSTATLSYSLYYSLDPTTSYSELQSISECAGSTCYSPTLIGWDSTANQPGWTVKSTAGVPTGAGTFDYYGFAIDAFGIGSDVGIVANSLNNVDTIDGFQINSNGTGLNFWQSTLPNYQNSYPDGEVYDTALPINYLGNGTTSILEPYAAGGVTTLRVFNLFPGSGGNFAYNSHDTGIVPYYTWNNYIVADVNGDGYDDVVWPKPLDNNDTGSFTAGDTGLVVALNGASGISNPGMNGQAIFDTGKADNPPWLQYVRSYGFNSGVSVADFNGDGRADFILNYGTYLEAKASVGTQTAPVLATYANILDVAGGNPVYTLDVNGDGLTDLLYICNTGTSGCTPNDWMLATSVGSGGSVGPGFKVVDTGRAASSTGSYIGNGFVVDFEGDGRQDFMEDVGGEWYVLSSVYVAGSGGTPGYYTLASPKDTGLSIYDVPDTSFANLCSSGYELTLPLEGDFNGDGLLDFATETNPASNNCPAGGETTNLVLHKPVLLHVNSIIDGLGNSVSVNYASIAAVPSANVYSQGSYLPANGVPFPGPLFVVTSYQGSSGANNGDASTYTISYTYKSAAQDRQGRGFLGFNQITEKDSRNGVITTTTYDQTFPYIGFIDEQKVTNSSGTPEVDSVNTTNKKLTSGAGFTAAYFPYVQKSVVSSYGGGNHDGLSGDLVKTVQTIDTYDSWGNLTKSNIQTSPEPLSATGYFEENIITAYAEDSANWCLDHPSDMTIAKAYGTAATGQGTTQTPGDLANAGGGSYASQARETSYDVDTVNCRVNSKTDHAYDPSMSVKTTYLYKDSSGNAYPWGNAGEVTVTDGNGATLRDTQYDFSGAAFDGSAADGVHPTSITELNATTGVNLHITQVWDQALGLFKSKTDVNNDLTIKWSYDGFGRKSRETEPDNTYTQWVYGFCVAGNNCPSVGAAYLLDKTHYSSNGDAGAFLRTKLDSFDRVVETRKNVTVAGGSTAQAWEDTQYNALGLAVGHSAPYTDPDNVYWTTTVYDILNRPITITKPVQAGTANVTKVQIYYNENYGAGAQSYAVRQTSTPTSVSDAPASEITARITDSEGITVEVDDAVGSTTYGTDAFGEVIGVTDSANNQASFDYDSVGHKTRQNDPDMGVWTYGYDALGELKTQLDANGTTITQNWDNLGRMYSRAESGPNGSATHTWTYDSTPGCVGQLGAESDNNGFTKVYNCDSYGRPTGSDTTIGGVDYNVSLGYDVFGRVQTISYPVTNTPPTATPPTVSASATPSSVLTNGTVSLSGVGVDANGLPMTYHWTQAGPATMGLSDPDVVQTSFTATYPGSYTFYLTASDVHAASAPAPVNVTVVPLPPVINASTGTSTTGNYTVSWNQIDGVDTYGLYENSGSGYALVATLSGVANTSDPFTAKANGTYDYEVMACVGGINGNCSAKSAPVAFTVLYPKPAAPTLSAPTLSADGTYNVTWNSVSVTNQTLTYSLEEANGATDGGPDSSYAVTWSCTVTPTNTCTSAAISHTGNGHYYYYYRVRVQDTSGWGLYSNVDYTHVVVVPSPVPALSPAGITKGLSITLTWTAASPVVTAYQLQQSQDITFATGTTTLSTTARTATYTKTTPDQDFYYRVRACNINNGTTECSGWSNTSHLLVPPGGGGGGHELRGDDDPLEWFGVSLQPVSIPVAPAAQVTVPMRHPVTQAAHVSAMARVSARTGSSVPGVRFHPALEDVAATLMQQLQQRQEHEQVVAQAKMRTKRASVGPQYAPPVYMAYAGLSLQPVTNPLYQFTVIYSYDSDENLLNVRDAGTGFTYWENDGMDAFGHVTTEAYGNGVVTQSGYDAATGLVDSVQSGNTTAGNFQDLQYAWDGYGNLNTRQDQNLGLTETFGYDSLNRLGSSNVSGGSGTVAPISIIYDNLGNITSKSAVGAYDYTGHVHQLQSVTLSGQVTFYQYDNNGDMRCSGGNGTNCAGGGTLRTTTWTPENQPSQITNNGNSVTFAYDPEGQRYQEYSLPSGGTGTTTLEVGDYAEVITPDSGGSTYRMMVKASGQTVAIHTIQSAGNYTDDYMHYDHLGSVDTITQDNGTLETSGKMSFDVFGQRRCSADWTATACDGTLTGITDRGYTNQQQLDTIGLIHMEGRVYDPVLGRFMSADPKTQDAYNSQGLNRYAYVNNNPLNSTDPTGFKFVYAYYKDANGHYTFVPPSDDAVPAFTVTVPSTRALVSPANPTANTLPVNLADPSDAPHVVMANSALKPVDTVVITVDRNSDEAKGLTGKVTVTSSLKDAPLMQGASLEPGTASKYPDLAAGWYQINLVHSNEFSPILKTDIPLVKDAVDDIGKSHGQVELHPGNTDSKSKMCELIGSKIVDTSNGPFVTSTRATVKKMVQSISSTIESDSFSGKDTTVLLHVVDPPPLRVPLGVPPP